MSVLGLPDTLPQAGELETTQIYALTILGARGLKSRFTQGHAPCKGSREESFPTSSGFGGLQALLDVRWIVAASLQSLFCVSRTSSPCVSNSPSSYKDTGHWI